MRERSPMESIRGLGNITGDYVGDGQGDCVSMVNVPNKTEPTIMKVINLNKKKFFFDKKRKQNNLL